MFRDDILDALGDLIVDGEKAKEVIDEFLSHIFVDIWHADDILLCAADNDIIVNEIEAEEILYNVRDRYTPEYGITWDYIGSEIEDYIEDRKDEQYVLRVGIKESVSSLRVGAKREV
jgi:hypothetical protein